MIAEVNGAVVRISGSGAELPVRAWNSDGEPMVLDYRTGRLEVARLVAAETYRVPMSKVHVEDGERFVAAIPAPAGWSATFTGDDERQIFPVVGFALTSEGDAHPILAWAGGPDWIAKAFDDVDLIPPASE